MCGKKLRRVKARREDVYKTKQCVGKCAENVGSSVDQCLVV